ncbi:alpha/beta hydrolase [Radiobacillus kanasensis]|uniref:alpha/beta fold hydrolase n=1 Tax=Radiobacillus kanasensis TaxID=2844358 RepID=UPI001E5D0AF3|nr:alpha/beta fold hydrolase [Radiobacillus kanasensis]UFT98406.1 alpha/beta hydrolase [Radiobacillus kanasensis]
MRAAHIKKGYIQYGNYKTYYEFHIPKENPHQKSPLILLAGGPGLSFLTLQPLLDLGQNRPVLVYDQIGSGRSTRSEHFANLSIDDFILQFEELVSYFHIDKYHLLGHSWGATLALEISLRNPQQVESLIFHSGIVNWNRVRELRPRFEEMYFTPELKDFKEKLEKGTTVSKQEYNEATELYNNLFFCRVGYPTYLQEAFLEKDQRTNDLIWQENDEISKYDRTKDLPNIQCKTLIISGKYDGMSIGQSEILKKGTRDSTHVEFSNSSHYAHIEEQSRFLKEVQHFLDSVDQ